MFKKVDQKQSFPKMEEEILKFWEENRVFEKSVEKNRDKKPFIFYEGPPTANGKPGLHHVLARAFKDIIPRYKTMKGFLVERKAGWDTHGLPVEIQVEKLLGIKQKHDILSLVPGDERQSVIEFNKKCKESVWEYKDLWEKMTRRMGYWVDMKNPYITYDNKYIESVWWILAQIAKLKTEKGENVLYKGHKVVPYCYRCGTALASHEVAQGYQTIKDNSVYVKFKVKPGQKIGEHVVDDNTYFLAWTTTPWTLPGNVALAVNEKLKYVKIKFSKVNENNTKLNIKEGDTYIIEENRFKSVFRFEFEEGSSILQLGGIAGNEPLNLDVDFKHEFVSGKELLDLEYEPLYVTNDTDKKSCYVVSGDFVTTQEGTGIVHIAPAFGADDSDVGRENDLPTLITVDEEGVLTADVPGKGIPVKKKNDKNRYAVDDLIVEDLKARGLFFKEEIYEHEYPFCWRCDTPLIYYAKPSWFIRMSAFSDELVKNNEEINWTPEYIKEGRFGEWLRGIKDWAISRDRYWGTPLPIWECKTCGETKVVESIGEVKVELGNPNTLFLVRHGESENNVQKIISCYPEKKAYSLTEVGKAQIEKTASELAGEKIDLIFSSPLQRTKETAEIISKQTGVEIIFDERLTETGMGKFNGEALENWQLIKEAHFDEENEYGAETASAIKKRLNSFLTDINEKYAGKNIVVVSHGDPLHIFSGMLEGLQDNEFLTKDYPHNGSMKRIFSKQIDIHKPYIDDVKFACKCGGEMTRTPEVMDVWFDSGSMPIAQFYYPNGASQEDKKKVESGVVFPADYISEAIDQTRGWFYTLHAIATLLNKTGKIPAGNAYKNVICLAHILDKHGKKMSKSRGNVVEPMEVMDQYGADMLRWMLFTINQPGMPKKFDIKGMQDIMNRVFRMLWNSYSFFVMYAEIDNFQQTTSNKQLKTNNLLDKWILSELNVLVKNVDEKLESYDIYSAAKSIESYIDNLSNWYIRRSRKRFWKSENDADKNEAYATLHHVLVTLSQLMAPFTPFIAEEIYKNLVGCHSELVEESNLKSSADPSTPLRSAQDDDAVCSVHLSDFPVADEKVIDEKLNEQMRNVRSVINTGLEIRASEKIKVRQPLSTLETNLDLKLFSDILTEELNIEQIKFVERVDSSNPNLIVRDLYFEPDAETAVIDIAKQIGINIKITPELKLKGQAREVIRFIQEMRKAAGYEVDNRIVLCYNGIPEVFEKFGELIAKETLSEALKTEIAADADLSKEFEVDGEKVEIAIKKVG